MGYRLVGSREVCVGGVPFRPTGWKIQSELPNPVNFEAATAFTTEDDMHGMFGVGPDASAIST